MTKLLVVFIAALVLAYISEQNTRATIAAGYRYSVWHDWAYITLVVVLCLFTGLRTNYNDTWNYVRGFNNSGNLKAFFSNPENLNPFKNPLFYFLQSAIKSRTDYAQALIFVASVYSQICLLLFIKRYSKDFLFSVFIYFTLGTFTFSISALKQVLAMATLTLAFPFLEDKKWFRYYLFVFIAMLFHTYSLLFAVLPFFRERPWRFFTFLLIVITSFVMMNFESTITAFMEQANDMGKTLAEYEVFADATINVFRLSVYAVPPLLSLMFQKWILHDSSEMDNTMIHMGIISFAFMVMGTQAGANMFGRMGNYFELGTICCLPWMLKKTFDVRSYHLVSTMACICFIGFFVYANAIHGNFDAEYTSTTIFRFLKNLFS
jgi:hypothetical protein